MKYCTSCGSPMPDESNFCTNCGANIASTETPVTAVNDTPIQPAEQQVNEAPQAPINEQPPVATPQPPQGDYYQPQGAPQPPQPQFNNYGYNAPQQPMPPTEEKASVGLAILSFIIPLVGLILFLTKKGKQPKTAKACGIAALVSVILGIVFSIIFTIVGSRALNDYASDYDNDVIALNDYDDDKDNTDNKNDDSDAVVYGIFNDTAYTNEYFNIKYNCPEDFYFKSYEEIAGDGTDYQFNDAGIPYESFVGTEAYYDYSCNNDDTAASIFTISIPKNTVFSLTGFTSKDVMDLFADETLYDGTVENKTDYYTTTIADAEFTACDFSVVDEVTVNISYYVTEKDGSFFMIGIITTELEDKDPSSYKDIFTAIQ